jgi:hypothetical protein
LKLFVPEHTEINPVQFIGVNVSSGPELIMKPLPIHEYTNTQVQQNYTTTKTKQTEG